MWKLGITCQRLLVALWALHMDIWLGSEGYLSSRSGKVVSIRVHFSYVHGCKLLRSVNITSGPFIIGVCKPSYISVQGSHIL